MISRRALLLFAALLLLLAFTAPSAQAGRELLSESALITEDGKLPSPPQEGQIEGACGLAASPGGGLFVSDYYHGFVDLFLLSAPDLFSYSSQQFVGEDPEGPCGLALDSAGNLYANVWHQRVERISPTAQVFDAAHVTGIAVDLSTDYLYAGHKTPEHQSYVSVYQPSGAPVEVGGEPLIIGLGSLGDAYGIAAFDGRVYVANASTDEIKVFEPAIDPVDPVSTIDGFVSLVDSALAVDPTNGHLLVVDNLQPGYEPPISVVREFTAAGAALGSLEGKPVFGKPSGIAIDPASGKLWVTDGNSEESNVFAYGPYEKVAGPLASPTPAVLASEAMTTVSAPQAPTTPKSITKPRPPRRHGKHRKRHIPWLYPQVKAGGRR